MGRHEDVRLQSDQLSGEVREFRTLSVRESPLDPDVLAFDVAELAQPLSEGFYAGGRVGGGAHVEDPDPA
jgi:hypothetical protein